jgi:quercetin dioxygenase-like cupin family protein
MCASDQTGTAKGELLIENDRVKVWRWSFDKKGDNTGWHRHEHDYVVVPLFNGVLDIDTHDGPVEGEMTEGVPYFRELGVEHDVKNGNDFPCAFIEIEVLR